MRFTLAVPTIGRSACLHALFRSLVSQSYKEFEVIIIDQNKDDRALEVINQYQDELTIKHLRQPAKGASSARNRGIEAASGEIVTFPDDDCEYPPDLLEKMDSLFEKHQEYCGLTVNTTTKSGARGMARLSKEPGEINKINILSRLVEFSIFLRIDRIGPARFDENFGPGALSGLWCDEGPDLILGLINKGCKFLYLPSPVVYHPNPTTMIDQKVIDRSYKYGMARGRYLSKHEYPFWYVVFVWLKYFGAAVYCLLLLKIPRSQYYWIGFKGRVKGYFSNSSQ